MYLFELVGEDDTFASYEIAAVTGEADVLAPGLALTEIAPPLVAALGYTRCVSTYEGVCLPTPADAATAAEELSFDRPGTAAVRAQAIRGSQVDTQAVERSVGAVLADNGFTINLDAPDHTLRVIFSGNSGYLGWEYCRPDRTFSKRQPADRPFFQPGSMASRLARALVLIAGGKPDNRFLDPMCGTGGTAIEAGMLDMTVFASDVQRKMVTGTQTNFREFVPSGTIHPILGSAATLPFATQSIDTIVFDAPYGRQSPIRGSTASKLVEQTLLEAIRLSPRAAIVTDRPVDSIVTDTGWSIRARFVKRVHRSLDRYIYDLDSAEVTGK